MDSDDDFCRQLLANPDKEPALEWLRSAPEGIERNLGEMDPSQSLREMEELDALGAVAVWAVEIDRDEDLEGTGKLVVELPSNAEERKRVFKWCNDWATSLGFDPNIDEGQSHVFVWLD